MKDKSGNVLIIGVIIGFLVIVGLSLALFLIKPTKTETSGVAPTAGLSSTVTGDIFRDGKVTQESVNLVKSNLGCKKADACWNKVIGKTHDGDNPIYTFDLDLNANGVIDEPDIPTLSK